MQYFNCVMPVNVILDTLCI